MRIRPYSDLHLDIHENPINVPYPKLVSFKPNLDNIDVLVLAGDIAEGTAGVEWASRLKTDIPIIYVFGNHEYYRHNIENLVDKAKEVSGPNVHVLEDETFVYNNVAFHGSTLWTDFNLFGEQNIHKQICAQSLNDFRAIKTTNGLFTVDMALQKHEKSLKYLDWALHEYEDEVDHQIVVTHHGPSIKSTHPRFVDSAVTAAFLSDLSGLLRYRHPSFWIHGHVHNVGRYTLNKTEVVHNPYGYPYEDLSENFDNELTLEL